MLAVVGVFIEIPIVSDYAFWFAVGAYIMLAGSYRRLLAPCKNQELCTK
jgi:hypothetical protein